MNSHAFQKAPHAASRTFPRPQDQHTEGLHQLFENTVDTAPNQIALDCEGVEYT